MGEGEAAALLKQCRFDVLTIRKILPRKNVKNKIGLAFLRVGSIMTPVFFIYVRWETAES